MVGDVQGRAEWLGHTAAKFVTVAAADLRARDLAPRFRRERHLLAMPVLGTGCVHWCLQPARSILARSFPIVVT